MIVLDTHVLVWWVADENRLSVPAHKALTEESNDPGGQILLSAITAWEVSMLQQRGRLVLSMELDEWLRTLKTIDSVEVVPLSDAVAVESTRLPGEFHKDPADRFIVALARELNVPLITADRKIRDYPYVRSIW